MELHERLDQAIDWWWKSEPPEREGREGSAKTLNRVLAERLGGDRSGSGYRTILTYLNGKSEPSLEWLAEVADVTGVRPAWLLSGHGQMTQEAEDARVRAEALQWLSSDSARSQRKVAEAFRINRGDGRGLMLVDTAHRAFLSAQMAGDIRGEIPMSKLIQAAVRSVMEPVRRGLFDPDELLPSVWSHYVATVLSAMAHVSQFSSIASGLEIGGDLMAALDAAAAAPSDESGE